jgi:hypothetical protein
MQIQAKPGLVQAGSVLHRIAIIAQSYFELYNDRMSLYVFALVIIFRA